jgi:hypothetical protein
MVRIPRDLIGPLDAWISDQPNPKPTRPEAIRQALTEWLIGKGLLKAVATPEAIAAKIEKLEAKADALKPGDGPPSPTKALKTMKRAVVKNEVRKLKNKLAATEGLTKRGR